jgi:hypothetical protein
MANQGLPAPAVSFPFVDEHGYLTVSAVQFLQPLAQAAQGLSGPLGDDSLFSGQLDRIRSVSSASSAWTPTVAGATTAGAQTYGTQWGAQVDIGPVRLALFSIVMSALDGTTAGAVQIAGFPVPSSPSAVLCAGWLGQWRATLSAS